jgi:hypothetical protein
MTREEVIPEWFYHPHLSPLNASIRGPQYLKAFRFPIKDFGNDKKGVIPECLYQESK